MRRKSWSNYSVFLSTPGVTDEEITVFLAAVDAAQAHAGALTTPDGEQVYVHRVSIDAALDALDSNVMRGSPLIIGLQWLALNCHHIEKILS